VFEFLIKSRKGVFTPSFSRNVSFAREPPMSSPIRSSRPECGFMYVSRRRSLSRSGSSRRRLHRVHCSRKRDSSTVGATTSEAVTDELFVSIIAAKRWRGGAPSARG